MKRILFAAFIVLCFGMVKANIVKKPRAFFAPKTFTVYVINSLKNYETPFKFFPQKTFVYGPAPKAIAFQNKLMIENSRSMISWKCLPFGKKLRIN